MSIGLRRPFDAVDYSDVARLFPPPPEYFEEAWYETPEEIDRRKLSRLRDRADRAYRVPFFTRRWNATGFAPAELRGLQDLEAVPMYTVDDIRTSIESHPPYGDYQGVVPADVLREPMRLHMSGGTTGHPRPTFYTHWDRAVSSVLTCRAAYLQGIRPGDVVLNSWSYGLHNGAFSFDEGLQRWLNCIVITTSSGNVTDTRKQVELAAQYQAAAILCTGDYLLRIVEEARSIGLDPRRDLSIRSLATNIGNEEQLEEIFGVESRKTYGFHEVGTIAVECPAKAGLHIFEDAFHIEIVDVDSGLPVPDGTTGAIVVTEFYKTGSPQYRYNVMDLSYLYPREQCECGSWLRRMGPFAGRGDNMVKLRGINVWPEAIGEIATSVDDVTSEYFVQARRIDGRDELLVSVESTSEPTGWDAIALLIERQLNQQLGVRIAVQIVRPGALEPLTEVSKTPKAKRFRDDR
jgi:phenylacetate-CoA ligase